MPKATIKPKSDLLVLKMLVRAGQGLAAEPVPTTGQYMDVIEGVCQDPKKCAEILGFINSNPIPDNIRRFVMWEAKHGPILNAPAPKPA